MELNEGSLEESDRDGTSPADLDHERPADDATGGSNLEPTGPALTAAIISLVVLAAELIAFFTVSNKHVVSGLFFQVIATVLPTLAIATAVTLRFAGSFSIPRRSRWVIPASVLTITVSIGFGEGACFTVLLAGPEHGASLRALIFTMAALAQTVFFAVVGIGTYLLQDQEPGKNPVPGAPRPKTADRSLLVGLSAIFCFGGSLAYVFYVASGAFLRL